MSLLSLAISPNFPLTNNHKRRNRHATILSHGLKKTQTSSSTSNITPLRIPSTSTQKLIKDVTSPTLLNPGLDHVSELEKKSFWVRQWESVDMIHLSWFIGIHLLAACAPFEFQWDAFWVAVVLSLLAGMGMTLGYHRLLSHRSFKIPKWLEYFFIYCGAQAMLKDPIFWVSLHKNHHKYSDTDRDPHTPTQGLLFGPMGWLFYKGSFASKCDESRSGKYTNVPELKEQWFYRFLQDTYYWHPVALATLLYLLGGLPYLAWGMGMRTMISLYVMFLVDILNHIRGDRPWNTPDTSTNHWLTGILALGDGWHNNHHAFPWSAQHGLEWWQFDLTWELIKFLEFVGLATDVKLPTEAGKLKRSIGTNQTTNPTLGIDHEFK